MTSHAESKCCGKEINKINNGIHPQVSAVINAN